MSININNTIISSTLHSNNFTISNENGPDFYYTQNNSTGIVTFPYYGTNLANTVPMFSVGLSNSTSPVTVTGTNIIPFSYTAGNGYLNTNGCYNSSLYRFTAPWTGLYLFRQNIFVDAGNTNPNNNIQPSFAVNGSLSTRRTRELVRIRLHGFPGNFFDDTSFSEMIYLSAGDYVDVRLYNWSGVRYYGAYSGWSGIFLRS